MHACTYVWHYVRVCVHCACMHTYVHVCICKYMCPCLCVYKIYFICSQYNVKAIVDWKCGKNGDPMVDVGYFCMMFLRPLDYGYQYFPIMNHKLLAGEYAVFCTCKCLYMHARTHTHTHTFLITYELILHSSLCITIIYKCTE